MPKKEAFSPLKIVMNIKNGEGRGGGGESLFLAHWLSYEKLNLCILCGTTHLVFLFAADISGLKILIICILRFVLYV